MPKKTLAKKVNEKVLVVERSKIFAGQTWHGINSENTIKYLKLILANYTFLPRGKVENDPSWQQIIPYLVLDVGGKIFMMRRKGNHTESRLSSMYSIGVGGHINKGDLKGLGKFSQAAQVFSLAKREFEEEVDYKGTYQTKFLGLLNDDSNEVGMVHLGLIVHLSGDSKDAKVKDEHKSGEFVSFSDLAKYKNKMETWSRIVYDFLEKEKRPVAKRAETDKKQEVAGILPDWVIADYIQKGIIQISPLPKNWKDLIDQVSVDFHLGTHIKLFRAGAYRFIDTKRGLPEDAMEEVNLQEGDPFILEPGAFAITSTRETLKLPDNIVGRLEGKSSLARLGILVHSTAARFDPGWNGAPVLELGNLGPKPAILYSGMPICAFTFERLAAPVKMLYEGSRSDRYSGSKIAVASKIHRSFKKATKAKRGRPRKS